MDAMTNFDPTRVAALETGIWRAYYEKRYLKLCALMVEAMRELYGLGTWDAARAATHFSLAAIDFRRTRNRENAQRTTWQLAKGFRIIARHATGAFDPQEAAKREYFWWMVDRYPEDFKTRRWQAISDAAAVIYGATADSMSAYATMRAEAMMQHDEMEAGRKPYDWDLVNEMLVSAYRALKLAAVLYEVA